MNACFAFLFLTVIFLVVGIVSIKVVEVPTEINRRALYTFLGIAVFLGVSVASFMRR